MFYQQELNSVSCMNWRRIRFYGLLRYISRQKEFNPKKCTFNLRVALFAEKKQNKFAYEFK